MPPAPVRDVHSARPIQTLGHLVVQYAVAALAPSIAPPPPTMTGTAPPPSCGASAAVRPPCLLTGAHAVPIARREGILEIVERIPSRGCDEMQRISCPPDCRP
jgi:hypothetical protein